MKVWLARCGVCGTCDEGVALDPACYRGTVSGDQAQRGPASRKHRRRYALLLWVRCCIHRLLYGVADAKKFLPKFIICNSNERFNGGTLLAEAAITETAALKGADNR
jgi:hypothetical protein